MSYIFFFLFFRTWSLPILIYPSRVRYFSTYIKETKLFDLFIIKGGGITISVVKRERCFFFTRTFEISRCQSFTRNWLTLIGFLVIYLPGAPTLFCSLSERIHRLHFEVFGCVLPCSRYFLAPLYFSKNDLIYLQRKNRDYDNFFRKILCLLCTIYFITNFHNFHNFRLILY